MFAEYVKEKYGKDIERCSDKQLYAALLKMVNEMAAKKEKTEGKKKLYYISAEFLIGKLLSNNLINLGIYDEVRQELKKAGKKLSDLEEMEPEPSLGNGGLGRLAACFLDSIATLGLPGDGIGLNYHFGLFRQVFKKRMQKELPNPWMEDDSCICLISIPSMKRSWIKESILTRRTFRKILRCSCTRMTVTKMAVCCAYISSISWSAMRHSSFWMRQKSVVRITMIWQIM